MSSKDDGSSRWSDTRDLMAAMREGLIVTAIVLVLVAPSFVRGSLERAGIKSFAGVEFGLQEVVDASEQVALAEAQVAQLSMQLASVESKLESLSSTGRSAGPDEIAEIASAVHSMKTKADSVDSSLMRTTRQLDTTIKLMPPEKLRELAERNARRQQQLGEQQTIQIPAPRSAELQGLLINPSELQ